MTKCPCEECICIPVCRHQTVRELIDKCVKINYYLYYHGKLKQPRQDYDNRIIVVEYVLKPTEWRVTFNDTY